METKVVIQSVTYDPEKDMLYLAIHSNRPSVTRGNRHDVLMMYDEADRQILVGIEVMDFATHLVPLLHKPGVLPALNKRFIVANANWQVEPFEAQDKLREIPRSGDADLRTVLEWCYHQCVLAPLRVGVETESRSIYV